MEIWKYELRQQDHQMVSLPIGARPLYVAAQYGAIVLYAHVDPAVAEREQREVWVHGTGHETEFSSDAQPMGVVSFHGGALMFHVFVEPAS